jgi:hypothetical protein
MVGLLFGGLNTGTSGGWHVVKPIIELAWLEVKHKFAELARKPYTTACAMSSALQK